MPFLPRHTLSGVVSRRDKEKKKKKRGVLIKENHAGLMLPTDKWQPGQSHRLHHLHHVCMSMDWMDRSVAVNGEQITVQSPLPVVVGVFCLPPSLDSVRGCRALADRVCRLMLPYIHSCVFASSQPYLRGQPRPQGMHRKWFWH